MYRIRWIFVLLSGCSALANAGCDPHVPLGTFSGNVQNILWYATFETGDLSEWNGDGDGGIDLDNDTMSPGTSSEQFHTGRFAGKATIGPTTGSPGMASSAYFYRNQPSPTSAYYAAWFYIPSTVTVRSWLSLMHFRSSPTGDGMNVAPYWDLNVYPTLPVGTLTTHFYNFFTMLNAEQLVVPTVPTDRWVHFEIMIRKATNTTGRVTIWQDDVMIIDLQNVATTLSDWMQWDAGGSSNDLFPATSSVYVDDATISLERLGAAPIPDASPQP